MKNAIMTAVQTKASRQFISAMGSMVENQSAVEQVLCYIEWLKRPANLPMVTMDELEKHGMPLQTAMNKLRDKARDFYQQA